ncbi:MAG: hemerythrin, partial [Candidatus Dadabacteria bacterium]
MQLMTTHPWPDVLTPLFSRAMTCEYASLTRDGTPITTAVTPHLGVDGTTIDIATGLAYPLKAERARRNPKVSLYFSDPTGSGLRQPPRALVLGLATVRDADLQANTDRYVRLSARRFRTMTRLFPKRVQRRGAWYFARIWIHVTPIRIFWWPYGAYDQPPQVWEAPPGTAAPPSDPPPKGKSPGAAFRSQTDWHSALAYATTHLPDPVLTTVDPDSGYPRSLRLPVLSVNAGEGVVRLAPPPFDWPPCEGPASLLFHHHPETFTAQENLTFVGRAEAEATTITVRLSRQVGTFVLGRNRLDTLRSIMREA